MYLNMTQAIYDKLLVNITLKGEKVKAFPEILGPRQGYSPSPPLAIIIPELLAETMRQEKEIKVT